MVGVCMLMAFEKLADESPVTTEACSDEGTRQLVLSWFQLARKGTNFSDEGLVEWWNLMLIMLACLITLELETHFQSRS